MFMCKSKSELFSEKNPHPHISKKFHLPCFRIQIPTDIDSLESIRSYLN